MQHPSPPLVAPHTHKPPNIRQSALSFDFNATTCNNKCHWSVNRAAFDLCKQRHAQWMSAGSPPRHALPHQESPSSPFQSSLPDNPPLPRCVTHGPNIQASFCSGQLSTCHSSSSPDVPPLSQLIHNAAAFKNRTLPFPISTPPPSHTHSLTHSLLHSVTHTLLHSHTHTHGKNGRGRRAGWRARASCPRFV